MNCLRLHRSCAPIALVWLMLGACGSDDDGDKQTPPPPGQNFATSYARIYCEGLKSCCDAAGEPLDLAACRQAYEGSLAAVNATQFDQEAAKQCLAELPSSLASCSPAKPSTCSRVLSGDAAPGQPCEHDADCKLPAQGWAICARETEDESIKGTCKSVPPPQEGQPCLAEESANEIFICEADPAFYCNYDLNTCWLRAPRGGDCSGDVACALDSRCEPVTRKCVARTAIGSACSVSSECIEGAYCDAGTCAAQKTAGQPCTAFDECAGGCDVDLGACSPVSSCAVLGE
jgi:hypothetical protein